MEIYRRKDIPWRKIDTEALIVNPKTSLIYPLNSTAVRIWELIDGEKDAQQITVIIADEFEADEETIKNDVSDFIGQLKDAGLVEKNDTA